jgi:membrane protease YdiL (CAAX protease family)
MEKLTIALIIQLSVITPLVIISYNRKEHKWIYLLLFLVYYFSYISFLAIPNWFPVLRIIESDYHWNWSGKIYAITGSIFFYILFRKMFANCDYITFRQNNSFRPRFYVTIFLFILTIGLAIFSIKMSDERLEYFLFQCTMPGLDEELAFRGILLMLLSNALNPKIHIGTINLGNPSVIITSILFGLMHSLHIDNNWIVSQNWFEFINTFAIGLLLCWMTVKSGSILMAILAHNVINTLPKIIFWM